MQHIFEFIKHIEFIKSQIEMSLRCCAATRSATNLCSIFDAPALCAETFAERIVYEKQMTDEHTALFIGRA